MDQVGELECNISVSSVRSTSRRAREEPYGYLNALGCRGGDGNLIEARHRRRQSSSRGVGFTPAHARWESCTATEELGWDLYLSCTRRRSVGVAG